MNGKEIENQKEFCKRDIEWTLQAFNHSPGLQRLRKLFAETPPPWPEVRDVPQEGP